MKKITFSILFVMVFTMAFAVVPTSPAYACGTECGCPGVRTPGYWKNHPEAWPITVIDLGLDGKLVFTQEEALYWMNQPVKKDKSITMFKAVIAARLNWEMDCQDKDAQKWYWEGVWWLENFPVGTDVKASSEAWQYSHGELIYWWLDEFNNGRLTCLPAD